VFLVPVVQAQRPALVATPANVWRHADRAAVHGDHRIDAPDRQGPNLPRRTRSPWRAPGDRGCWGNQLLVRPVSRTRGASTGHPGSCPSTSDAYPTRARRRGGPANEPGPCGHELGRHAICRPGPHPQSTVCIPGRWVGRPAGRTAGDRQARREGRSRNDRVAASAAGRCVRSRLAQVRFLCRWGGPEQFRSFVCTLRFVSLRPTSRLSPPYSAKRPTLSRMFL
jgi:hypothetical protein